MAAPRPLNARCSLVRVTSDGFPESLCGSAPARCDVPTTPSSIRIRHRSSQSKGVSTTPFTTSDARKDVRTDYSSLPMGCPSYFSLPPGDQSYIPPRTYHLIRVTCTLWRFPAHTGSRTKQGASITPTHPSTFSRRDMLSRVNTLPHHLARQPTSTKLRSIAHSLRGFALSIPVADRAEAIGVQTLWPALTAEDSLTGLPDR